MNRFVNWLLTSGLLAPAIGIVTMYIEEAFAWTAISMKRLWKKP